MTTRPACGQDIEHTACVRCLEAETLGVVFERCSAEEVVGRTDVTDARLAERLRYLTHPA